VGVVDADGEGGGGLGDGVLDYVTEEGVDQAGFECWLSGMVIASVP